MTYIEQVLKVLEKKLQSIKFTIGDEDSGHSQPYLHGMLDGIILCVHEIKTRLEDI